MTGKMTVLPNGLKIVTDTMDEVDTVSLGIWVDIGAMYERPKSTVFPICWNTWRLRER